MKQKQSTEKTTLKVNLPIVTRSKAGKKFDLVTVSVDLGMCPVVGKLESGKDAHICIDSWRRAMREASLDIEENIIPALIGAK